MSLVGSYVALSKPLAAAFPVLLLAWMRFGIGALAMLTWLKKPADEPPLTPQTRGLLFLQSLLGNFLFTVCMIYGVSLTSATSAGVIMACIPACVAVMSWLFLRERVARRTWVAVACAVIGIALFSLSKPEHPAQSGSALEPDNAIYLQWLGYALLLMRYVDDPRKATEAQIHQAAMDTVPPVGPLFWTFRIMVALGMFFIVLTGTFFWHRLFGIAPLSATFTAGYAKSDSDINFYDSESVMFNTGLLYNF